MAADIVVVLHGCCPSRAHCVALALGEEMARRKMRVKVIEADFASCTYWDGLARVFVSPSPVLLQTKTPVVLMGKALKDRAEDAAQALLPAVLERLG